MHVGPIRASVWPTVVFVLVCVPFLLFLAWISATDMTWEHGGRDIWQHAAALRELINDPFDPSNPFVSEDTGSRHFHPLWVGGALIARTFELDEWAILAGASYLFVAVLALGIYMFARAFQPSPWAPLVVFLCLMASWVVPVQHTGYIAPSTLLYGAAYPATFLVGASLIMWAVTLRAHERPILAWWLLPLSAVMFTTHQLGAVIGFLGAGCFAVFHTRATRAGAVGVIASMLAGIAASALWPYHNPIALVFRPGHSDWSGGPDFYGSVFLTATLVPAAIGLIGLVRARHMALLAALAVYVGCYLLGLAGIQLAGRFLAPVTLVLQLGMAISILDLIETSRDRPERRVLLGVIAASVTLFHILFPTHFGIRTDDDKPLWRNHYIAAQSLTDDIPDQQQVAAHPNIAWPIVATGQRVLSIPWPEPLIDDLAERQRATAALFSADLSAGDRVALARAQGVRSLIVQPARLTPSALETLQDQAVFSETSGTLSRFDLYD